MVQRHPDLAALGLVRLPRSSADRNDRRPRLLTERCPLDVGANEDECARGCVHALAVELEGRAPALDEIKLLLQIMLLRLVVLVDEPIADLMSCKGVDAERRDAEVEPDGPRKDAAVIDFVDLVDPRHRVTAHSAVLSQSGGDPLGAQSNRRPGTDRTRTLTRTGTVLRRRGYTRSEVGLETPLPSPAPEISRPVPGPDGTRSGCSTAASPARRSS